MSSELPYRVVNSGRVADEFRELADQARVEGRLPAVLAAGKWIVEEMSRTPSEFGESRQILATPGGSMVMRCGFARPVYVEYAVREADRIVFLRRFVLLRSSL